MSDISKARALFQEAGLAFPCLPARLASSLKERGRWCFSTRPIDVSPYDLNHYVNGGGRTESDDYAVLAHSGHGANSYAIQYYLVCGPLRMFLFLGWGGVYMDAQNTAEDIRLCFSLADRITKAAAEKLRPGDRLLVVGSDFYGNYWSTQHDSSAVNLSDRKTSQQVLGEVLTWLDGQQSAGEVAISHSFRHAAGFGKRIEYWIIGRMLKDGLDVYVPLVDDDAIDAVIRRPDGAFTTVQIKARSRDVIESNAALFAAIPHEARENYWFVFYSERMDMTWVMTSQEFIAEAAQNKTGKNKGKRSIWFNGTKTDKKTGQKIEYCKKQFEKYVVQDFGRLTQ